MEVGPEFKGEGRKEWSLPPPTAALALLRGYLGTSAPLHAVDNYFHQL